MGVSLYDGLVDRGVLATRDGALRLTKRGAAFLADFGIDAAALAEGRRPLCKGCLDWSMRREHLAGSVGAALLARIVERKWARRDRTSRAMLFSPAGEAQFRRTFGSLRSTSP
jgi:hypothetical protein